MPEFRAPYVKAKKSLGQHFLIDKNIAGKIVDLIPGEGRKNVIEIGPGKGILSEFLLKRADFDLVMVEIDKEASSYLGDRFPSIGKKLITGDFLSMDILKIFNNEINLIGNFPYNISSPLFFKILENKESISRVVCMVQKEVADRITAREGSKTYGILSVLLQTFFDIEYAFTVNEKVFQPPPKVKSAVIKLERNKRTRLPCNEKLFFSIVKAAFNQRRKMLRNALSSFIKPGVINNEYFQMRAEQLSVQDFISLSELIGQEKSQMS
jgi:16S rRNA (adenine1518-N6/adenine1519-N6)-dimethyltransferase